MSDIYIDIKNNFFHIEHVLAFYIREIVVVTSTLSFVHNFFESFLKFRLENLFSLYSRLNIDVTVIHIFNSLHNFAGNFFSSLQEEWKFHLSCNHRTGFCYVTLIHPWSTEFPWCFSATSSHPAGVRGLSAPYQITLSRVERSMSNHVIEGWAHDVISRGNCVKS